MEASNDPAVWTGAGMKHLLLHSVGRRSGAVRKAALPYWEDDDGHPIVVASYAGAPEHPGWFLNLEDAFADWEKDKTKREWRTHFHVPVFLTDLGPFKSTQFALEQALAMHKKTPLSRQLEIETYTWDVLPDHLKTGDIVEYVCRELEWVKGQLI
jgi:hypothetical protein